MNISDFRDFIEEHDLNCLEVKWVENRRCEFYFVTNKANTMFKVVYEDDKNGTLSLFYAGTQHGTIDYFMDASTMESMLLHQQYRGIYRYRGNNIVPLPETGV